MSWGVGLLILGFAFLLLTLFAVPVLIQVRRTARKVEVTLGHINQNLPDILDNLHHTTDNLRKTTEAVRRVPADIQSVTEEFRGLGGQISRLDDRVRGEFKASPLAEFGVMKKSALVAFVIIRVLRFLRKRRR